MNQEPNDHKLCLEVARMLPQNLLVTDYGSIKWIKDGNQFNTYGEVNHTEWLYVAHLVEQTLTPKDKAIYAAMLRRELGFHQHSYFDLAHATFNQRARALCAVKWWGCE